MATQLYAKIKRSSKYSYQNQWAKEQGQFPFPVEIARDFPDGTGYVIRGGPGGQYTVRDVNLYALVEGREGGLIEVKLS